MIQEEANQKLAVALQNCFNNLNEDDFVATAKILAFGLTYMLEVSANIRTNRGEVSVIIDEEED